MRLCDRIPISLRITALSWRNCILEQFRGAKLLGTHGRQIFSRRHNGTHSLLNHLVDIWDIVFVLAGPLRISLTVNVSIAELPVGLGL